MLEFVVMKRFNKCRDAHVAIVTVRHIVEGVVCTKEFTS